MTDLIAKTMFDSFSIVGIWATNRDIPIDRWNHGELKVTPETSILTIYDSFYTETEPIVGMHPDRDYDVLYGFSEDGKLVTLSTAHNISWVQNMPGIPQSKYLISDILITNEAFTTETRKQLVSACTFSLTYMDTWLPNDMVTYRVQSETHNMSIDIADHEPKLLTIFKSVGQRYKLSLHEVGRTRSEGTLISLQHRTEFYLECLDGATDISIMIDVLKQIARFFSVLFAKRVDVKYFHPRFEADLLGNVLFSQGPGLNMAEAIQKFRFKPYYTTVESEWCNALQEWFKQSDELNLLSRDYLVLITQPGVMENMLINLTEGIESYYRHFASLSLRKKLNKALGRVPNDFLPRNLLKVKIDDLESFTQKVTNTRVYLTHGTNRKARYEEIYLYRSIMVFKAVVRYIILKDLGFSDSTLSDLKEEFTQALNVEWIDQHIRF